MRFGVLGSLAVWTADGDPVAVPEAKVRALLADLLLHLGQPVSADRLIEDLWDADPPANAANSLQNKVSQLRRALESGEPGGRDLLALRPAGYVLRVDADALDARRFTQLAAHARAADGPRGRAERFAQALGLWRGPALADFRDEPFAQAAIGRLEEERLVVIEEQAKARLELGEHAVLTGELGDLVARHPLRERLRAAHMRALYRAGRQSEALGSYHELRERLSEELGIDPDPELSALYQAILKQDPALRPVSARGPAPRAEQPAPPLPGRHGNLPVPLTELIGRGGALDDVGAQILANRLVTLTGPGGVGKTRLAVATAAALAADGGTSDTGNFDGGAWVVELAGLTPSPPNGPPDVSATGVADLAERVAAVIGLRDETARGPIPAGQRGTVLDRLGAALAHRRILVVLDNCEHVIEPAAELVDRLLSAAPGLRILATSREPLGVSGEAVWTVPPLDKPSPVVTDPAVLREFSAARLFLARAAQAEPGFTLTADNAVAVAAICRRLDGIPLALELAASRVRAFDVKELADRLDDRFRLLSSGKRGVPARQRTLSAMIDWSWGLLGEAERTVLRRLAVQVDGCTLAAAQAVCSGGAVAAEEVPELLAHLVDRSLVVTAPCVETRYGLLESVAAYCLERLDEAGEADAVRRRHRRYYLELAERAEPHLRGPDQRTWLDRLDAESANLRRVLDGAVRDGDAEVSHRLACALAWYWYLRGRRNEASRSLSRVLDVPGRAAGAARVRSWHAGMAMFNGASRAEPNTVALKLFDNAGDAAGLAMAQWFLGHAEFGFGDLSESERLVNAALAGFHATGDRWGVAAALGVKASQAVFRGDLAGLRQHGEQSAALFAELGDGWGQLLAIEALGMYAEITGDYARAAEIYRGGQRIAEDLQLWPEIAAMLSRRGRIALLEGDHSRADELLERARDLAVQHANTAGEEFADLGLALSARRQGRLDEAEARLRRWLDWNRAVEADYGVALILAELGFVAELRGDAEAARALHRDGLAAARNTGDPRAVALALEGLAGAESLAGEHARAAGLLGAAHAAREGVGAPLPPGEGADVDRITARTRAALGSEAFTAEFNHGTQ